MLQVLIILGMVVYSIVVFVGLLIFVFGIAFIVGQILTRESEDEQ